MFMFRTPDVNIKIMNIFLNFVHSLLKIHVVPLSKSLSSMFTFTNRHHHQRHVCRVDVVIIAFL